MLLRLSIYYDTVCLILKRMFTLRYDRRQNFDEIRNVDIVTLKVLFRYSAVLLLSYYLDKVTDFSFVLNTVFKS